jgi:hypothetical protein
MQFCGSKGILNKNYKDWMMKQSASINKAAEEYGKKHCGRGVIPLPTWRIRKEELAHEQQRSEQIESGLIGIWSCLEAASSYRARYCERSGYPQLRYYQTRCKHLYFYFDHEEYGFMNIRLQTWFPYHIQVCLNGREWLRRCLERKGIDSLAQGNKFLHISDYEQAQNLLNKQLDVRFTKILNPVCSAHYPDYFFVVSLMLF